MSHCDAVKFEVPIDAATFPYFASDYTINKNRTQKNFDAMVASGLIIDKIKSLDYSDQYVNNKNRTQKNFDSMRISLPIPR